MYCLMHLLPDRLGHLPPGGRTPPPAVGRPWYPMFPQHVSNHLYVLIHTIHQVPRVASPLHPYQRDHPCSRHQVCFGVGDLGDTGGPERGEKGVFIEPSMYLPAPSRGERECQRPGCDREGVERHSGDDLPWYHFRLE